MAKHKVKNSGVAFEYGDRTLIVPPLSVNQMKRFADKLVEHDSIQMFSEGPDGLKRADFSKVAERVGLLTGIVAEAVRRNYPDFTDDEAGEFVTAYNANTLLSVVVGTDRNSPQVREVGED